MSLQKFSIRASSLELLPRRPIAVVRLCKPTRCLTTVRRQRPVSYSRSIQIPKATSSSSIGARTLSATAAPVPEQWTPPSDSDGDADSRPVVIIGAGVIGRRLAVMWASTGKPVILQDTDPDALLSATAYVADTLATLCAERGSHPGRVQTTTELGAACTAGRPWMVVEAVPENRDLKIELLGAVDGLVPEDCIVATNSSTWPASQLKGKVGRPERLLSTHYYVPPRNTYVELMSSGATCLQVFPYLAARMRGVGLTPLVLPRESPGFVFYRIWAAVKAETLKVLAEGLASPRDVDALFRDFFHAERGPCEKMDEVGLHAVLAAEKHFLEEVKAGRGGKEETDEALRWLQENYVDKRNLGEKTGSGLYSARERAELGELRWKERRDWARRVMEGESKGA